MNLVGSKKLLLASGTRGFSLSGSWETGLEGWSGAGFTRQNMLARTGSWSIRGDDANSFSKLVSPQITRGLTITFSVWAMTNGGGQMTFLEVAFGDGSFQTIGSDNVGLGYRRIFGSIEAPVTGPATFRIRKANSGSIQIDDWSIVGTRS